MKTYIFLLALALGVFLSCAVKKTKTIQEVEHKENYSPVIKKQIEEIKTKNNTQRNIVLEKGIYHFYPEGSFEKELYISNHDQDNPKKVAFYLENLENVVIDAKGSQFIFHGTMIPFVLKNCQNVVLKNFSIDFKLPHLRQLTVLSVDKTNDVVTALIEPSGNYFIENDKLNITVGDYRFVPSWLMAFNEDKRLAYNRADVDFNTKKVSEIRSNELKIEGWSQSQHTSVGERFVLRSYHRPTPGIVIDYSKNTRVENVKVHYAYGMGLLAQLSENITLDKFAVCLKENDSRYFTTQADATHFSACKGIIRSENGLYEGMADDAINVHGTYLKIIERTNDHTIKARYMHDQAWGFLWGEVGDEVQFISSNTMDLVDNKIYKIKSIKSVDKPSEFGAKVFEIAFTENIPQEIEPSKPFGIENLTWTPEVIFNNNLIRNNRARGALFSTPKKVVCENNVFDHTHGTAILLCGDCNGWYETGACRNVIIKNNKFINALTARYQFTNAVISIYPEIPNLKDQKQYFHSGIVIENNVFEMFDEPILYAKSVDNLVFKDNKVIKNDSFKPFHWNTHKFLFEHVKNVTIENNHFEKPLSEEDIKVNLSNKEEINWKK
ncbi:alpha-1,3-galactosidase B [Capnocytophaga cynodegmi]|uniref:alpha-1,3-galactosidase-related protein n=1 Tax=Capnocytophaga cynodegmi TaxID=28189 RepID=UPI0038591038